MNHFKHLIFVFMYLWMIVSCGTGYQLRKSYVGKSLLVLKGNFGDPETILDKGDEKIYIYQKITELESTEVSQGKLTLDPMISPKVIKSERYFFTVKDSVIVQTRVEEAYERR